MLASSPPVAPIKEIPTTTEKPSHANKVMSNGNLALTPETVAVAANSKPTGNISETTPSSFPATPQQVIEVKSEMKSAQPKTMPQNQKPQNLQNTQNPLSTGPEPPKKAFSGWGANKKEDSPPSKPVTEDLGSFPSLPTLEAPSKKTNAPVGFAARLAASPVKEEKGKNAKNNNSSRKNDSKGGATGSDSKVTNNENRESQNNDSSNQKVTGKNQNRSKNSEKKEKKNDNGLRKTIIWVSKIKGDKKEADCKAALEKIINMFADEEAKLLYFKTDKSDKTLTRCSVNRG